MSSQETKEDQVKVSEAPDTVNDKEESISEADRQVLMQAEVRKASAKVHLEKAQLASECADLVYQNLVLQVYLKYKISFEDKFNPETGKITRK